MKPMNKIISLINAINILTLVAVFYLLFLPDEHMLFDAITVQQTGYVVLGTGLAIMTFFNVSKRLAAWFDCQDGASSSAVLYIVFGLMLAFDMSWLVFGYVLLGLAVLNVATVVYEGVRCKRGGCISGLMLVPAILLVPAGIVTVIWAS